MSNSIHSDSGDFPETELLPGVYVTDFRTLKQSATTASITNTSRDNNIDKNAATFDIVQLDMYIDELTTSIQHLIQSNNELSHYIIDSPQLNDDHSLSDAINENKLIIERKQGEVEVYSKLRDELNQHVIDTNKLPSDHSHTTTTDNNNNVNDTDNGLHL